MRVSAIAVSTDPDFHLDADRAWSPGSVTAGLSADRKQRDRTLAAKRRPLDEQFEFYDDADHDDSTDDDDDAAPFVHVDNTAWCEPPLSPDEEVAAEDAYCGVALVRSAAAAAPAPARYDCQLTPRKRVAVAAAAVSAPELVPNKPWRLANGKPIANTYNDVDYWSRRYAEHYEAKCAAPQQLDYCEPAASLHHFWYHLRTPGPRCPLYKEDVSVPLTHLKGGPRVIASAVFEDMTFVLLLGERTAVLHTFRPNVAVAVMFMPDLHNELTDTLNSDADTRYSATLAWIPAEGVLRLDLSCSRAAGWMTVTFSLLGKVHHSRSVLKAAAHGLLATEEHTLVTIQVPITNASTEFLTVVAVKHGQLTRTWLLAANKEAMALQHPLGDTDYRIVSAARVDEDTLVLLSTLDVRPYVCFFDTTTGRISTLRGRFLALQAKPLPEEILVDGSGLILVVDGPGNLVTTYTYDCGAILGHARLQPACSLSNTVTRTHIRADSSIVRIMAADYATARGGKNNKSSKKNNAALCVRAYG